MSPSWDSLSELEAYKDLLNWIAIWAGVAAVTIAAIIGAIYKVHTARLESRIAELKSPAYKPPSAPSEEAKVVPSPPQSAPQAVVPDASSDKQHDTKPPAPVPPVYAIENPTPEYIEKILSENFGSARDLIKEQFVGTPVSWDGIIDRNATSFGIPCLQMKSGLDSKPNASRSFFFVPAELPKNKFLLQLQMGTSLHVDGVIDYFVGNSAQLKDVTAKVLRMPDPEPSK